MLQELNLGDTVPAYRRPNNGERNEDSVSDTRCMALLLSGCAGMKSEFDCNATPVTAV